MHFFLSVQNALSVVWIPSYNLFFHGVNFATVQANLFRECQAWYFGEELWMLMISSAPPEALSFAEPRGKEAASLKKCLLLLIMGGHGRWLKVIKCWLEWNMLFGQWGFGLGGICFCRNQDMKVFITGWRIQGGFFMMPSWMGGNSVS